MNVPFVVAGALAVLAAAIHGTGGEIWILPKLFSGDLPSSRFGGPSATRAMIRFTWHAVSLTFLAFGAALATCGVVGPAGACQGVGILAANVFTAFVALTFVVVFLRPRALFFHPGPLVFVAVAALAWWGTIVP